MSKLPLQGLRVHVEGMGLTGCLLAYHLERAGAEWSWHDVDAPVTAWKASTGAIYPAGKPGSLDYECYRVWDRWVGPVPIEVGAKRFERALQIAEQPYRMRHGHFESGSYWFNHKAPPHHGDYKCLGPSKHGLQHAEPLSYHLNAQTFVPMTRSRFKARRREAHNCHAYVVAHGFSARMHHALWGWHVPVTLKFDDYYAQGGHRPCFYFREGRFVMAYAYPIANSGHWYAGSSLIFQHQPAELEVEPKYERWKKNFERLGGGAVKVTWRGDPVQGWRPAQEDAHCAPIVQTLASGRLVVPPLWHSGIRHFPSVLQQLLKHLGRIKEAR